MRKYIKTIQQTQIPSLTKYIMYSKVMHVLKLFKSAIRNTVLSWIITLRKLYKFIKETKSGFGWPSDSCPDPLYQILLQIISAPL